MNKLSLIFIFILLFCQNLSFATNKEINLIMVMSHGNRKPNFLNIMTGIQSFKKEFNAPITFILNFEKKDNKDTIPFQKDELSKIIFVQKEHFIRKDDTIIPTLSMKTFNEPDIILKVAPSFFIFNGHGGRKTVNFEKNIYASTYSLNDREQITGFELRTYFQKIASKTSSLVGAFFGSCFSGGILNDILFKRTNGSVNEPLLQIKNFCGFTNSLEKSLSAYRGKKRSFFEAYSNSKKNKSLFTYYKNLLLSKIKTDLWGDLKFKEYTVPELSSLLYSKKFLDQNFDRQNQNVTGELTSDHLQFLKDDYLIFEDLTNVLYKKCREEIKKFHPISDEEGLREKWKLIDKKFKLSYSGVQADFMLNFNQKIYREYKEMAHQNNPDEKVADETENIIKKWVKNRDQPFDFFYDFLLTELKILNSPELKIYLELIIKQLEKEDFEFLSFYFDSLAKTTILETEFQTRACASYVNQMHQLIAIKKMIDGFHMYQTNIDEYLHLRQCENNLSI